MRTPAGRDCRHYFEDFHRGRNVRECRLLRDNPASLPWRASDCSRCPVPDILYANASPELRLALTVRPRLLGLGRSMKVRAWCRGKEVSLSEAHTGCPGSEVDRRLDVFRQALERSDDDGEEGDTPA